MTLFLDHPELLPSFRRGERAALERVYRAYVDRVETIARAGVRLLRGPTATGATALADVRDLVQETFARAFAERARLAYDGQRPYAPFLGTIARNLVRDAARRIGREITVEELPDVAEPEPYADPVTMRAVEEYVASLDPELRAVHEQRYVRCESQEDAARALGLSRQQLRTLERRLRDGLAARLGDGRNQESASDVRTIEGPGEGRRTSHG